jgi:hypothetical protein
MTWFIARYSLTDMLFMLLLVVVLRDNDNLCRRRCFAAESIDDCGSVLLLLLLLLLQWIDLEDRGLAIPRCIAMVVILSHNDSPAQRPE